MKKIGVVAFLCVACVEFFFRVKFVVGLLR
jgi:hypothetical protein